jgi:hypothetical protein
MSTLAVNSVTDANGGNTATINSMTPTADSLQGFRNRIINGDMRIDQRNAGAAVTINTAAFTYSLDRWRSFGQASDGAFTVQQDTSAPAGFVNSAKITVTTADASIGASQGYNLQQSIEGTNTADLAWGTANAKTVTLSFWVRSSLTGTFGGAIRNNDLNRSYPFTYSISVADTWEYKTVTIPGDTTGTWLTTTGIGVNVLFSLGAGSNFLTTGGSWNATNRQGVTGQTQLIGTLNATWYVTGVQLEVGSVATPFERRPYGTELNLCKRYYEKLSPADTFIANLAGYSTTAAYGGFGYYEKRATPSFTAEGGAGSYVVFGNAASQTLASSALFFQHANTKICRLGVTGSYTQGSSYFVQFINTGTPYIEISSEL